MEFSMADVKNWGIPGAEATIRWAISKGKLKARRGEHIPGRPWMFTEQAALASGHKPLIELLPILKEYQRRMEENPEEHPNPMFHTLSASTPTPSTTSTAYSGIPRMPREEPEEVRTESLEDPLENRGRFSPTPHGLGDPTIPWASIYAELRYLHQMQDALFDMVLHMLPATRHLQFTQLQDRANDLWDQALRRSQSVL